jgi:hypothetical protein
VLATAETVAETAAAVEPATAFGGGGGDEVRGGGDRGVGGR